MFHLFSPAKVNLSLQILQKRNDGYHELYTVFQKITLFDEILIEEGPLELFLEWEEPEFFEEIPLEKNLLFKALKFFENLTGIKVSFRIRVKKRIPPGAGLGGGSSNAGTFLRFLMEFYSPSEDLKKKILEESRLLGADVPFFLMKESCSEARGIGEVLTPFPSQDAYYLVIYPGFKISTSWAYKNLKLNLPKKEVTFKKGRPFFEQEGFRNDFEPLVFSSYPVLKRIKEELMNRFSPEGVLLSGSGSSLFAVFSEKPDLKEIEEFFEKELNFFSKNGKIWLAKNLK